MRRVIAAAFLVALAAVILNPVQSISAEQRLTPAARDAGIEVGTAFLLELANPANTKFQVGVVVTRADRARNLVAFMISPKSSPPAVQYIAGRDPESPPSIVAMDQIANPGTAQFEFTVIRKDINPGTCPALTGAIVEFYSVLEATLSTPVPLAGPPPGPTTISMGGPDYVVKVALAGWATLSINDRTGGHPLSKATAHLYMVTEDCSNKIAASVEQDYAYSSAGARLLRQR